MSTEESKDRFLSDSPIENVDEDEFRHREYVDTLERMVEDVDPPWNIGVFGEWGSGKTSIIRMLYSRFRDPEADCVCVEFDAWKHAEESMRTDLLLNLDQAIGENSGQDVDGKPGVLGEDRITQVLYDAEEEQRTVRDVSKPVRNTRCQRNWTGQPRERLGLKHNNTLVLIERCLVTSSGLKRA